MYMRMYESFSGCRVLSYCLMSNHFHILLEVPPMAASPDSSVAGGLTDEGLLHRLSALYSEAFVAEVAEELGAATKTKNETCAVEVHARFTCRMYSLSQFMKGLLIRFTRWFNRTHSRTGTLREERFKSVIVESGIAARTMAAYIDLNPVRADMVKDPADYRWSSYGEALDEIDADAAVEVLVVGVGVEKGEGAGVFPGDGINVRLETALRIETDEDQVVALRSWWEHDGEAGAETGVEAPCEVAEGRDQEGDEGHGSEHRAEAEFAHALRGERGRHGVEEFAEAGPVRSERVVIHAIWSRGFT